MNRRNFIRIVVGGTTAVACGVTVAKEESTLARYIRENIEKRRLEKQYLSMLRNSSFGAYGQYGYFAPSCNCGALRGHSKLGKVCNACGYNVMALKCMGTDFDGCFFDLRQSPKLKTATLSGYFLKG